MKSLFSATLIMNFHLFVIAFVVQAYGMHNA